MEPEVKLAEVDVPYAVALRMKRAVLAASEMSRQGPCAIGQ